jgi:hypothetical protein
LVEKNPEGGRRVFRKIVNDTIYNAQAVWNDFVIQAGLALSGALSPAVFVE